MKQLAPNITNFVTSHRPAWHFFIWTLLVLAPIVGLLHLMLKYGVMFPFWDQWELVPYIHKLQDGTLAIGDLWEQHNEHRIFFPRTLMIVLAALTQWSNLAEILANLAIAICSFILMILMLRKTFAGMKFWPFVAATTILAWIFFSAGQWENWLWGWQIQWYMSVFGLVLAMWALTSWPDRWSRRWRIPVAVAGGVIANYSLGNGLLVWPAGLVVLLLMRETWKNRVIWAISGIVAISLYYYGYLDPSPGEKTLFLREPLAFLQYVSTYLGGILSVGSSDSRITFGVVLLSLLILSVVTLWIINLNALRRAAGWLGLTAYAGISACLAGVARLDLGVIQAASSRYTTISTLFLIGTLVLLSSALWEVYKRYSSARVVILIIATLLGAALLTGIFLTYSRGVTRMSELQQNLAGTNHCIHAAADGDSDCLLKAYPKKEIIWPRIQYLRSIHWAGF